MKRTVVVLGTLLGVLLTATSPALAQIVAEDLAQGAPPPPEYVLTADGTLIMGGDIVLNCNEWSAFYEQYSGTQPTDPEVRSDLEGASGVLEECERAGFSYSGGTGAGSGVPNGVEDAEGTPVGGVTEDGFVRTKYDTFVACDSGFPVVEQYAQACGEAGLPQADAPIPEGEDGSAALAQPIGEPPVPDLPDYVLTEDGTVIIDSDTGESCRTFASSIPTGEEFPTSVADAPPDFPLADDSPDFEQARGVLEQCEQAGFLPPGSANPPPTDDGDAVLLPETGGPALLTPLAALLVSSGVLVAVLKRRNS